MKMTGGVRALDKIFRRRDRYDIPDWQREEVWKDDKKQRLVDSILRGWKLPKFYFVKIAEDQYEVVDGQQRLSAIFDFFSDKLRLPPESAKRFGGAHYSELPQNTADAFDDFEIEYDVIEEATDEELKEFFQRLQAGLQLNSSEKLNAIHSNLRNFCRQNAGHALFKDTVAIAPTRYSHFDIVAKVATLEIEGLDAGLRFDDIKGVFEAQRTFAPASAVAKRIKTALDLLNAAFKGKGAALRTRTVVQSLITLTCRLVATGRYQGHEKHLRKFFEGFTEQLAQQIEMGSAATDSDYTTFQHSINANVRGGARIRHEILLRKMFQLSPDLADAFDPSILAEGGFAGRIASLGDSIVGLIEQLNAKHAAKSGDDLFKATAKTAQAQLRIRKPIRNADGYEAFVDDLYFLFHEGVRLDADARPQSFKDVNTMRTDLRHDVDHGDAKKVRSKRRKFGTVFEKYAGAGTPETLEPARFPMMQANVLGAIEGDLRTLLAKAP